MVTSEFEVVHVGHCKLFYPTSTICLVLIRGSLQAAGDLNFLYSYTFWIYDIPLAKDKIKQNEKNSQPNKNNNKLPLGIFVI